MYVDTPAMEHMWSSMDNLHESVLSLYHVGLRDWTQVPGLMTSTILHWTISLALTSKIVCARRALYYRTRMRNIPMSLPPRFLVCWYIVFFWYKQKALFQASAWDVWEGTLSCSEVHTTAAGQILLDKVGCQPVSFHAHPTLPFEQGYKSALCDHGESCMFHLLMGWGGGKSLLHAQRAGKVHPVFPLLYNNHFYKPETKNAWERGTHQLTSIAKNMTSQPKPKGPHYPCKSSVPFCTHKKNRS